MTAGTTTGATAPFRSMLETLPDPVMLVAGSAREDLASRRFTFANPAARDLLRLPGTEGRLLTAVRHPAVLQAVDEALFDRREGTAIWEQGGPRDRCWRVTARPLDDEGGNDRLAVVAFNDQTDARRNERMRADFLANASHELRTPLASLSGFIETLRGHARDDEAARERFLSVMQVQAERMARLIDDLLSLSRIELNEHIPPLDRVDLALAAAEVVESLQPLARERAVTLDIASEGRTAIIGERDQIIQLAQNLIANALKYAPADSAVTIRIRGGLDAAAAEASTAGPSGGEPRARHALVTPDAHPGQAFVALTVSDGGPGLAREHLPRLSERFYRAPGQKSGAHSGTGLGLAIVKHLVNRHMGGLAVESAPGCGAAFVAYFPQAPVLGRES
jgi:two-component system, OmpR family, phosphate regulon sensor histidine kinase PhoR